MLPRLAVIAAQMGMIGREIRMVMVHRIGIGAGPEPQGGQGSDGRNRRHCGKRRRLPDTGAQQTHQGIADQPGAMAERELSSEQGRAVVGIGRASKQSARWRRSEEHTSELQSLMRISYAVFCLKKKHKYKNYTQNNDN